MMKSLYIPHLAINSMCVFDCLDSERIGGVDAAVADGVDMK